MEEALEAAEVGAKGDGGSPPSRFGGIANCCCSTGKYACVE
jgi:hypothetical protein